MPQAPKKKLSLNRSSSRNLSKSQSVHNKTTDQIADGIRLNKYISDSGFCSRREADKLITAKRVTINDKIPEMGTKVFPNDTVCVDGRPVKDKEKPIYIALNKPTGITCTTERHIEGNIIDFIKHRKRIFPIGRLDKPSDGLIFLTNDGDIVNKILRAGNAHEKEYVVRVDKPISDEFIQKMATGVDILDTKTLPCKVKKETEFSFRIILTQGLNRQIRRMCEALGYDVYKLRRVRIMNISIDGLPNGKWRYLTDAEMNEIHRLLAHSSKTEGASRIDATGAKIQKATDAKLYDARKQDENLAQKAFKTYHGSGEFERKRHPQDRSEGGNRRRNQDAQRPTSHSLKNTGSLQNNGHATNQKLEKGKPATRSPFKSTHASKIKKWTPKAN